jgi:uncharacterized membrane protein (DUF485 family)
LNTPLSKSAYTTKFLICFILAEIYIYKRRLDFEILIAAAQKKREKKSRCLSFGRIHA